VKKDKFFVVVWFVANYTTFRALKHNVYWYALQKLLNESSGFHQYHDFVWILLISGENCIFENKGFQTEK